MIFITNNGRRKSYKTDALPNLCENFVNKLTPVNLTICYLVTLACHKKKL